MRCTRCVAFQSRTEGTVRVPKSKTSVDVRYSWVRHTHLPLSRVHPVQAVQDREDAPNRVRVAQQASSDFGHAAAVLQVPALNKPTKAGPRQPATAANKSVSVILPLPLLLPLPPHASLSETFLSAVIRNSHEARRKALERHHHVVRLGRSIAVRRARCAERHLQSDSTACGRCTSRQSRRTCRKTPTRTSKQLSSVLRKG